MSCVAGWTSPTSSKGQRGSVLQCVPNGKTWGSAHFLYFHSLPCTGNISICHHQPCDWCSTRTHVEYRYLGNMCSSCVQMWQCHYPCVCLKKHWQDVVFLSAHLSMWWRVMEYWVRQVNKVSTLRGFMLMRCKLSTPSHVRIRKYKSIYSKHTRHDKSMVWCIMYNMELVLFYCWLKWTIMKINQLRFIMRLCSLCLSFS